MALVAIPASAQSDDTTEPVKTYGHVDGGDTGETGGVIVCKWELPDADPETKGMQYGGALGRYYDGPGYPCRLGQGYPRYEEGQTVLGIEALPHDLYDLDVPEQWIELWSAVTTASGPSRVDDVYWKIFHPDGTGKVQDHGEPIAPATADQYGVTWDNDRYQITGDMWGAASPGTRQISEDAVEDRNFGLVQGHMQGRFDLWRGGFALHKDQPCGPYRVENHVVVDGDDQYITNYIWVHCFIDLQTDFRNINWGVLTPEDVKYLNGNTDWGDYTTDGPWGSQFMTVGNGGSQGMVVGVQFAPLVQQKTQLPKLIKHFDAKFGMHSSALQSIDPIYSSDEPEVLGETYWFNNDYDRTVCANEKFKLDLSVHVPKGIPNGEYLGLMRVMGMGEYGMYTGTNGAVTNSTDNEYGICNNSNGVWDDRNQRPTKPSLSE